MSKPSEEEQVAALVAKMNADTGFADELQARRRFYFTYRGPAALAEERKRQTRRGAIG